MTHLRFTAFGLIYARTPARAHEAASGPARGECDYQLAFAAPCGDYGVITSVITSGGVAA